MNPYLSNNISYQLNSTITFVIKTNFYIVLNNLSHLLAAFISIELLILVLIRLLLLLQLLLLQLLLLVVVVTVVVLVLALVVIL